MPIRIPLSAGWRFSAGRAEPELFDSAKKPILDTWGEPVDLPHCFDSPERGTYAREIEIPGLEPGGRADLRFEGVAVRCRVWADGTEVGFHAGPYTPFTCTLARGEGDSPTRPVTKRIVVEVDGAEDPDTPPFGKVVDYLVYPGIYRGVNLLVRGPSFIGNLYARPSVGSPAGSVGSGGDAGCAAGTATARLTVDVEVEALPGSGESFSLEGKLTSIPDGRFVGGTACAGIRRGAGQSEDPTLDFGTLTEVELWDVDTPRLYLLEVILKSASGEVLDSVSSRIGFRDARWTPGGFFLNGRRLFLRGLNRHQCYPYSQAAMGPGGQRADAARLKRELGITMVRSSHYPPSPHFLDACDELGLLVFEELPGWQHIGSGVWKERALDNLRSMILRDRHHPGIVLWGTRINESADDHDFYKATSSLAKKLDPDRALGGVRCIRNSELLEDVYTFNDFTCDSAERGPAIADPGAVLGRNGRSPYLVTEHNGHMFPAKRFDREDILVEQALRHARVLDAAMGDNRVSGALGWCAFDYHTHSQFGSGDGICYHGVADLCRIPKPAAALYASQIDPSVRPVLEIASGFHPGDTPAFRILPIRIFTNCDDVRFLRGGEFVGTFRPDRATYPHLAHPPILIDDLIGDVIGARLDAEGFSPKQKALFLKLASRALQKGAAHLSLPEKLQFAWLLLASRKTPAQVENLVASYAFTMGGASAEFELVGMLGGKEVIRKKAGSDSQASALILRSDAPKLACVSGGEWDATRIEARLVDQYGTTCRYVFEPLEIRVEGPGRLIGPSTVSLVSGAIAFWVATVSSQPGDGKIGIEARCGRYSAHVELILETMHG